MIGYALSMLWTGMVMGIHPCPLATNVVAISYLTRDLDRPRRVLAAGLVYTVARAATYLGIGVAVLATALSSPQVARFLQRTTNQALGPVLIVMGMVLLRLVPMPRVGGGVGERAQRRVARGGLWGAALLGILFALAFCPPEAAVFFGVIVVSAGRGSRFLLPAMYGLGTGLPVLAFALAAAAGARSLVKAFDRLKRVERWARAVTGSVFILVGICFSLAWIFRLPVPIIFPS